VKEIVDRNGVSIPLSRIGRVTGGIQLTAQNVKPGSPDPTGPYHFTFHAVDGSVHLSIDYPNAQIAEAERQSLEMAISRLAAGQ
jgi:hypothetical protein